MRFGQTVRALLFDGVLRGQYYKRLFDATGMSEKTLKNIRAVGAIRPDVRRDGVSFGHHEAVAERRARNRARKKHGRN